MTNKLITKSLVLIMSLAGFISCSDMNKIQSEFEKRDEIVYLGKVDSLKSYPGFGRAKIVWHNGSDPKIEKTVIYWNQRQDSLVKDFTRTSSELQKDSIFVENLREGATVYEFRNTNNKGEYSLYSTIAVESWGGLFADKLRARRITSTIFDYEESIFELKLTPAAVGDSVVYSQIMYTDAIGATHTIKVDRETNQITLPNFNDGAELKFRNVFFLPQGMDTVYSDYQVINAPKASRGTGKSISLSGNPASRYSTYNNKSVYEWNLEGDLILHEIDENGVWRQAEAYTNLVSRTIYRDFFFYDDDKFIGIGINNMVYLLRIENHELIHVRPPSSSNPQMGEGFSFPLFIPAKGFFYTINAGGGALRSWPAQNNATWGTNNGATVLAAFPYSPVTLFDYQYLIAVDEVGDLWSFQLSSSGSIRNTFKIGKGWNRFNKLFSCGNKLIAIEGNNYYEFDFDPTGTYWIIE